MLVGYILIGKEEFSLKRIIKIFLLLDRGPLLGAIWFIGVLFYTIIGYDCANRLIGSCNLEKKPQKMIISIIALLLFLLGINTRFKFRISNILVAIGWLHLGGIGKHYKEKIFKTPDFMMPILFAIIAVINCFNDTSVSKNLYTYKTLHVIAAFAAIWGIIILCKKLSGYKGLVDKLAKLGKNTIGIVIWQFVAFKFGILLQIIIYDLPLKRITSYPILYDKSNFLWIIVYTVIGIFVSIAIHKILLKFVKIVCTCFKNKICRKEII